MEARDTKTDLAIAFEATAGSEESEAWWAERVCRWQRYSTMIETVCKGRGSRRAAEGEMPFKDVVFEGMCGVIR